MGKLQNKASVHNSIPSKSEWTNGTNEQDSATILNHACEPMRNDWDKYLPMAEFAINGARQESTGFSPFYLTYGEEP